MNKLKMFFIAAAITFVLSGCGTKQSNNSSVEKVNKAVNDEPVQYDPDETIELDNGQKWKVNEEMKPFLLKGKEILNEYIQNEDNDYT